MKLRTIYDLGANHGEDTARYLHYADKVISVEANPIIAEGLSHKFAAEIAAGRVELLNIGIWNTRGKLPFYRHNNDHWSSFDPNYGMREGGYEIIDIETVTFPDLVRAHGQPDFLKIDIEGADRHVIASLRELETPPRWVSIENYGLPAIRDLSGLGYTRFKIAPQSRKAEWPAPEGELPYTTLDTGPPPWTCPGAWLNEEQALSVMDWFVQDEHDRHRGNPHEWYDVHAALADAPHLQP